MKSRLFNLSTVICLLLLPLPQLSFAQKQSAQPTTVPLGGNAFFSDPFQTSVTLSDNGLRGGSDGPSVSATVYVRFLQKGRFNCAIIGQSVNNPAALTVSVGTQRRTVRINGNQRKKYPLGAFTVTDTGYVAFVISGVAGKKLPDVESLVIDAPATQLQFVKDEFYWGRRGPSVHLNFKMPARENIEWFYSEITVPKQNDVIGSYFMANGFAEGYFGFQVNSPNERRVLFSVWSPFSTDDPKAIPDSLKIVLLKKGRAVQTGEFGNEGSGGQSFLRFDWKAERTYGFLTHIQPSNDGSTTYTAYFFDPEKQQWLLIASFARPKTQTWHNRIHSFLENFYPETGAITRMALYGNQWVCNTDGVWTEITQATFTHDATARKKARMDYAGGNVGNAFFLKNCGFFGQYTPYLAGFWRTKAAKPPKIDFKILPND